MNASVIDAFGTLVTNALVEIVSKISGYSLVVVSAQPDPGFEQNLGFITIYGQTQGTIFLSVAEPDMRMLCASMVGVDKKDVTQQDIYDGICELLNMAAGNLKLRVGNPEMVTFTPPLVINGESMNLITKNNAHSLEKTLASEEISIKLKVVL